MLKALAKLIFFAILPVLLLLMSDTHGPIAYINSWFQERFMSSAYLGSFRLIDAQLESVSSDERDNAFQAIADNFGLDLKLESLESFANSDREYNMLLRGKIVFLASEEDDRVAYKLRNHDQVITASIEETDFQETYRLAKGPIFLIRQSLIGVPHSDLEDHVVALSESFGFNFQLVSKETAEQLHLDEKIFQYSDVVWYLDEDDNEVFLIDLDNGRTIIVEPPVDEASEIAVIVLVISLMFTCAGAGICIWLWPLWRDHKRLNASAQEFGRGHLDSRVTIGKGSLAANLGESFNLMADNIQQLITANQQLTNAVAHDLRTPLARLRFATEMLNSGECSTEESKRYQQTIGTSIDALDYLINQTLLHSRYNRSTDIKHFKQTNFAAYIEEEVEHHNFDSELIEFTAQIDHALTTSTQFIDAKALRRALSNLLDNAAKHANSLVNVSYFKQDRLLCLRVEDDGPGVDNENFTAILEPYLQLDNDERDHTNGLGLGLAIVNQITKWHKGEIVVSQSKLGGACFTLCWDPSLIS